jgi:hypothetical protein
MAKFVVTIQLPDFFDEDFVALIPRHRAFINQLLEDNIVETYAISADRTRGWVTMNGKDAQEVRGVVTRFPLFRFFTAVEVNELFIYDSNAFRFPRLSLN